MTLGKRIAAGRKRLGLTQDQLADKIGITAQAVSKWENDQSCPDISTLPKLADILQTTTDALLGRAEAPTPPPADPAPVQPAIKWSTGSRHYTLRHAFLALFIGAITLTAALLGHHMTFWSILWPSVILVVGVSGSWRRSSFFRIGCLLLGGWFLLENTGLLTIGLDTAMILPIILLLFGFSLLLDAMLGRKAVTHHGHHPSQGDYQIDGDRLCFRSSFGENRQKITMTRLSEGDISVSFGDYELDFSGVDQISDGCFLSANCSFGELLLVIPSRYLVQCDGSTSFASIETIGHPDPSHSASIALQANCSFGQITIKYI
ncbi:MAG: helix-turn-helix transcriptional regulator [Oscillospiraceae bacterium]|nr:helix-turn-helix transcriptional regulator [Oscillospiraceae bacterium]